VIYDDVRGFPQNTYQLGVFDDLLQIVFRPGLEKWSPVRLFFPQWYVPRQSIVSVRLTSRTFRSDKIARKAIAIEFSGRSGIRKRVIVGADDPASVADLLAA